MIKFYQERTGAHHGLGQIWLALLLASLICGVVAGPVVPARAETSIYFKETNLTLSDEHHFLSYWQNHGGLAQFGYPITPEILEVNPADQKTYIVQWFERNRFEYHPEFKGTQYEVLLGLLGRQLTIGRENEPPFKSVPDPHAPGFSYFPQTGHTLANSFREYWEAHGGLSLFGYPVTEEFQEMSTNGQVYTTQWFERARFEYHPENKGTPYDVLLGLLGNQIVGGFAYPDPLPNNVSTKLVVPNQYRTQPFQQDRYINLPPGFKISVFAGGLTDSRLMALAPTGDIFVTERFNGGGGVGTIKILRDLNKDGIADEIRVYASGLSPYPHGIAFYGGYLYVALETKVIRYPYVAGDLTPRAPAQTIINNLPQGQSGVANGHNTRTIVFGPDGKMYVQIGSSCDACIETDPLRASVWQYNPDGTGGRPYATGLRNAVALGFDPKTNLLWAGVNGRNGLGDDFPPEQLTPLRDGGNYGWPYCAGTYPPQPDPQFGAGKADFCANQVDRALLTMHAHIAPLGLTFYNATMFPEVYRGGLFVVTHGSAPSETPQVFGDGIWFVSTRPGKLQKGVTPFANGWINSDKKSYWGRTVFPLVGADGALYVSDDTAGAVYRISYGN
ncbi:MAG: PQQ-dependent sugar dehydrogenase [Chloroflexi bacterium]|nr:PQQ-dependent sugar dehydrogenase [Chloroflexota bacterium]